MGLKRCCDLAAVPNVAALKEAAWTPSAMREVLSRSPAGFAIYSGDDATGLDSGGGRKGIVSVTANVAPRLMHELCVAVKTAI